MKAISARYPLQRRRPVPCVVGVLGCRNQFPTVSDASGMSAQVYLPLVTVVSLFALLSVNSMAYWAWHVIE
jgi:hypothetical protein